MARQLSDNDLMLLRQRMLLKESETAFKQGNDIVAEDLITRERRIINVVGLILEANQQILHD